MSCQYIVSGSTGGCEDITRRDVFTGFESLLSKVRQKLNLTAS